MMQRMVTETLRLIFLIAMLGVTVDGLAIASVRDPASYFAAGAQTFDRVEVVTVNPLRGRYDVWYVPPFGTFIVHRSYVLSGSMGWPSMVVPIQITQPNKSCGTGTLRSRGSDLVVFDFGRGPLLLNRGPASVVSGWLQELQFMVSINRQAPAQHRAFAFSPPLPQCSLRPR